MASLLPGFEYDVFISYRHKDNKYDGWVTEFVGHLKKKLEATFKDEISALKKVARTKLVKRGNFLDEDATLLENA